MSLLAGRLRFVLLALPALWWSSCATGPEGAMPSVSPEAPLASDAVMPLNAPMPPAEERPGLATKYGDELRDPMVRRSFVRASKQPVGTDRIYYNDRSGIEAMTSHPYKTGGTRQAAGGMVEWGIKSGFGYATCYESGGKRFVVGSPGKAYSIVVKNRCRSRVEVVLSVDGLDVMDGKPASFAKRGYLIAPGDTLEVKGWRSGWDTVARFEFSSVGASYANRRHGDTRNVGVIGLAVFGEKGADPWKWMPDEVERRESATPFATAP
ncbi:hypothetical protein [Haloferula sp. A504]|uniref:hypothetical protein n=1 Tax=Haloferula sp. A504 TaxID=3373601 RepID=UPI0031C74436|nr:hypothetical protein [Verrucomicrobiaceae bacterium E54]